jgi:hypothetical protein
VAHNFDFVSNFQYFFHKRTINIIQKMKISIAATTLALLVSGAQGFTVGPSFSAPSALQMSEVAEPEIAEPEVAEAVEIPDAAPAELSGLRMKDVRKAIDNLDKDNFDSTLQTLEPYLVNEARSTMYKKSVQRIAVRAKALGVEMPEKYAFEAKATLKKREKQNAFIQQKEEERLAAEAAAADEPAVEEAAAEEVAEEVTAEA